MHNVNNRVTSSLERASLLFLALRIKKPMKTEIKKIKAPVDNHNSIAVSQFRFFIKNSLEFEHLYGPKPSVT